VWQTLIFSLSFSSIAAAEAHPHTHLHDAAAARGAAARAAAGAGQLRPPRDEHADLRGGMRIVTCNVMSRAMPCQSHDDTREGQPNMLQ
jgi:hypothetical protein